MFFKDEKKRWLTLFTHEVFTFLHCILQTFLEYLKIIFVKITMPMIKIQ